MAILYSAIANGNKILVKHATCAGNFQQVTEQILAKIPSENAKITYSHGNFLFHYIADDRIVYFAITEDDFERSVVFRYLAEIKKKFRTTYGSNVYSALPYSLDSEFSPYLHVQMNKYSKVQQNASLEEAAGGSSKVQEVQSQLDELKDIMVQNIDSITDRGENLNLLVDKTEDLNDSSISFKKASTNLARKMWWKKMKMTLVLAFVVILVLYFIVSAACGGLNWHKCIHKGSGNDTTTGP